MLRKVLLGLAILVACAGAIGVLAGHCGAAPAAIWGGVLLAALLLERWRYRSHAGTDVDGWEQTGERFIDPETGRLVNVFYRAASGERRYVPVDEDPA